MPDELKVGRLQRDLNAVAIALTRAAEGGTAKLSFAASSETPVERWFGTEVLQHKDGAIRMDRIKGGAVPLLFNHDWSDPIGMVDAGALAEGRLMVDAHLFDTARAKEVDAMIAGGLRNVSIGYQLHVIEEDVKAQRYTATDWEPYEISIVTVPADASVGIGRSKDDEAFPVQVKRTVQPTAGPAATTGVVTMSGTSNAPAGGTAENPVDIERKRVADIVETGQQYLKYGVVQKDIDDAVRNGRTVDQFRETIMQRMQAKADSNPGIIIGMTGGEAKRYSLGRALVAAVSGDWSKAGLELEASRAVERIFGKAPEGFYIPADVFRRDFNVGTTTEAGNLVATDLRTDLYVDALRNALVAASLGMRILPGLTSSIAIPRKSVASTIGTLTEIGSASETNPNIQQVTLSPKRMGAFIEVSKQALIQSAMALEGMLRDDLIMGAAVLMESNLINGNGTSPQMTGIRNTTGIGTVTGGSNGLAPAWSHFVDLESACANSNSEPDRLAGYLLNTRTRGKLKQTTKSTYLGWVWDNSPQPLNGYRAAITNNVPNNLTKGTSTTICSAALFSSDWSMAVLGLFGAPDITVDPYTKADTGQVKITINQFADFGIRQPGAFAKIEDLLSG